MSINETGIIPDIEIKRGYEQYEASGVDNQLEKAKEVLTMLIEKK
jgi:C-terminal processing protease CtpA/Prc